MPLILSDVGLFSQLTLVLIAISEQLEKHERERAEKAGELATLTESAKEVARLEAEQREKNQALQQVLEEGRCFTKAEVFRLKGLLVYPPPPPFFLHCSDNLSRFI